MDAAAEVRTEGRPMTTWQDIGTAPHEVNVLLAYWDEMMNRWQVEAGMASWGWRRDGVSNMSRHGQATHWEKSRQWCGYWQRRAD